MIITGFRSIGTESMRSFVSFQRSTVGKLTNYLTNIRNRLNTNLADQHLSLVF